MPRIGSRLPFDQWIVEGRTEADAAAAAVRVALAGREERGPRLTGDQRRELAAVCGIGPADLSMTGPGKKAPIMDARTSSERDEGGAPVRRNAHAGRARRDGCEFRVLTDDDLADIHLGTLEVLERTGVFVEDEEAREIFAGAGATVDAKGVVRIPGHVVEQAVRTAPSKLRLAGRDPKNDVVLEAGRVGFTNFGEGVQIIDPYTGDLRVPVKQDVANTAKVVDALPNVDVYERAVVAEDIDQRVVHLHQAEAWMSNTSKHGFMGSGNGYLSGKLLEMAAAVVGGRDKLRGAPDHLVHHLPGEPAQAGEGHLRDHHGRPPAGTSR